MRSAPATCQHIRQALPAALVARPTPLDIACEMCRPPQAPLACALLHFGPPRPLSAACNATDEIGYPVRLEDRIEC
jgi:hypothetical protein